MIKDLEDLLYEIRQASEEIGKNVDELVEVGQ